MRSGIRKHFFNEDYFEIIDNSDKAYWLGFIAADGAVCKSSKYNSYRLSISVEEKDIEHLRKFLSSVGGNDIKIEKYINTIGYSNKEKPSKIVRVVLNSYKMCLDLEKYHIHQNKSYDIKFPNISQKYIPDYLRGVFDGDGSYYCKFSEKENRYRLSFELVSMSKDFIEKIKDYFTTKEIKLNIYSRVLPKSGNTVYRLMSGSIKEITKLINLLYNNPTMYLSRKFNKVNIIRELPFNSVTN